MSRTSAPDPSPAPEDHLLRTLAAVPVSARILDVACGEGRRTVRLDRLGFDCYGCDVDPGQLARARERLGQRWAEEKIRSRLRTANAASLDFPDDFFDWVVAHGVYHRAAGRDNVVEMVRETARVLKPGGWVHCAVPARTPDRDPDEEVPGDGLVERRNGQIAARFTDELLTEVMTEAGLAVAEEARAIPGEEQPVLCAVYRYVESDERDPDVSTDPSTDVTD